jgi:isopentenyl-diphosphate delta-isomerase
MPDNQTNQRKMDHLRIVTEQEEVDRRGGYFERLRLKHRALPELDFSELDTSVEFLGKHLSFPLLISSMTGGDHEQVRTVNRNLAVAAEATGVAMGVGSQRVMFTNPAAEASFALRSLAPETVLMGNLGAVQLNCGFGVDECRRAVDVLEADALFLHLNPLQEAIQPEGDLNFSGLAEKIGQIAEGLPCPVIVKEVGSGIGREDAEKLRAHGIRYLDVAGSGGTSWSRIEHHRQEDECGLGITFSDWGIPTPRALLDLQDMEHITLIGSGGIRSGVDMVKAMALGASLCGMARPLLQPALKSAEAVVRKIECLREEFKRTLFLLGIRHAKELKGNMSLLADDIERHARSVSL